MEFKQFNFSIDIEPKFNDVIFKFNDHTSPVYIITYPSKYKKRQVLQLLVSLFEAESEGHIRKMRVAGKHSIYRRGTIWGESDLHDSLDINDVFLRVADKLAKIWY